MKRTSLAFFLVACFFCSLSSVANAQGDLYQLSLGIRSGNQIIGAKPPYFALHPPVYYDRIVPRAYGMSPFAVPAGVMPIENKVPVPPKAVSNPFFQNPNVPAEGSREKLASPKKLVAVSHASSFSNNYVINPFYRKKVVAK